jgi:hypothetical protein
MPKTITNHPIGGVFLVVRRHQRHGPLNFLFRPRNKVGTLHTLPIDNVDQTWLPCCALRDYLCWASMDYLAKWKDGVLLLSDWVRELGCVWTL